MLTFPWFRFGYVVPHLVIDMDPYQFYSIAPEGVMLVASGLDLTDYEPQSVERVMDGLWDRLELLAGARLDWLSLSGVPLGAGLGRQQTRGLVDEMSHRLGIPASTDIEAHISALHHLGVSRVALATRWPDHVAEGIVAYMGEAGIRVSSAASPSRSLAENKTAGPSEDHQLALELGRRAVTESGDPQALLLPGGLWFAVHAALELEEDLGIPVLTNVTSSLWEALWTTADRWSDRELPGQGMLLGTL